MKTSQFNVTLRSNTTKAITNSKQNKIDHEGQDNRILVLAEKETNQLNLSDCPRDSLPINSITNSTICFDPSRTHRWINRQQRRSFFNCRDISEGHFKLDIIEK